LTGTEALGFVISVIFGVEFYRRFGFAIQHKVVFFATWDLVHHPSLFVRGVGFAAFLKISSKSLVQQGCLFHCFLLILRCFVVLIIVLDV